MFPENCTWNKLLSTRFLLGIILAGLGFVAYMYNAAEFLVFGGFLAGIYGTYVAGNTRSKNVTTRTNGAN